MKHLLIRTLVLSLFLNCLAPVIGRVPAAPPPKSPASASKPPVLHQVELTADGILNAQVVNRHGQPLEHMTVQVTCGNLHVTVVSDAEGRFAIGPLTGGLCIFRLNGRDYACRTWKHGIAPPGFIPSIALVDETTSVVLGNNRRNNNCCLPDQRTCSLEAKYGLAILGLGATAAYFALSRDNASE